MQRIAVFVDAGYVYAQSAVCLTGANVNRAQLKLLEAEFIEQLKSLAATLGAGAGLLRVYWYDGAKNGLTVEQLVLADMQDVKVRLGSINSAGQQKGVDSLLVTDLIDLARNQAISDALVVTGDGDMRIAVQIAQSFGVRVHLVGLEPSRASQSPLLRQEADTVHEISKDDVTKFMRHSVASAPQLGSESGVEMERTLSFADAVRSAIETHLSTIAEEEMTDLRNVTADTRRIPEQYDRRILGSCGAYLKRKLSDAECRAMRKQAIDFINQA